jgi:choline dehydrogenase-like flavoprotein
LKNPRANLTFVTEAPATKLMLDGKKGIGVEAGGKKFRANKEVIISAGALDMPK